MTNYVQTDHGIVQLNLSDLSGTITSSQFTGTATNGYSLLLVSGIPTWQPVTATSTTNVSGGAANSLVYQTGVGATGFIAAGTNGYILSSVSGVPTWTAPVAGTSITGTANQVIASASTGAVTLSLPQSIATTSSVQFSMIGLNASPSGISAGDLLVSRTSTTGCVYFGSTSSYLYQSGGAFSMVGGAVTNSSGFVGPLSGNASTATLASTVTTTSSSTSTAYQVALANGTSILYGGLTYNPGTSVLTAGTLTTSSGTTFGAAAHTYGSVAITGSLGSYAGIQFTGAYGAQGRTLMVSTTSALQGFYDTNAGAWDWYISAGELFSVTSCNGAWTVGGACTATSFSVSSDANKKDNIRTFVNAEEVVQSLRGVSFDWKADGSPSIGVIAQEVEAVLPELVTTRDDDSKVVNYNGLIGVLIEAVKALQIEVAALKAR